jgi:hypothetical protein
MFSKRNPSEARPNGRSAPKGTVKGATPPRGGHPVKGKGRGAPTGTMGGKSPSNKGKITGGKGNKSSRGGIYTGGNY